MKAQAGTSVAIVESAIEDIVAKIAAHDANVFRQIAADNDKPLVSLAIELGKEKERAGILEVENLKLRNEIASLEDQLHVERQNRLFHDVDPTGTC